MSDSEAVQLFQAAVQLAMIRVMLSDGCAGEQELRVVREVAASITGTELSEADLRREIALAESGQKDVSRMLVELAPHLTHEGKALVVKAAFLVAAADGRFRDEEKALLSGIATSLGLTEELIPRMLAAAGDEHTLPS